MILDDVYSELNEMGYTNSQLEFSEKWLGKSHGYLSMLKATDRKPSPNSLIKLMTKMNHQIQCLDDISSIGLAENTTAQIGYNKSKLLSLNTQIQKVIFNA